MDIRPTDLLFSSRGSTETDNAANNSLWTEITYVNVVPDRDFFLFFFSIAQL